MITIINSETKNILSVMNMLKKISYETIFTDNYDLISSSTLLIDYINRPPKAHEEYSNSKFVYNNLLKFYKFVKKNG